MKIKENPPMDPPAEIELNSKIPSTAGQSDPVKPFGY